MDILGKFTRRSERSAKTWKDTKTYFSQRYDLLKLEFLEKSTQLLSVIFSMLIVIVCTLVVLIYLSSAVIHWLTLALGAAWAYTILCVLFVGIIVFVLAKKDVLFVKPLIRKFSRIMYPDEVEELETENVVKDAEIESEHEEGGQYEQ
ncbi:MAG: phage holin family protein [Bacteroidales bacterium]|nr:phage holin family protein [Bacteroidales bacterium]